MRVRVPSLPKSVKMKFRWNKKIPVIKPRWYQLGLFVAFNFFRYIVISWPRRHGKDVCCFSLMVREAMKRVGTYYYYFPTLEDGKEILWENRTTIDGKTGNMIDLLCPEEIVSYTNNQDYYKILTNGSVIRIEGTDKLSVVGTDGCGYVFSEWQKQKPEAFDLVRPILRQNRGWVIFNGTMRGKMNHLYKMITNNFGLRLWYCEWLKPKYTKQYYWESPPEIKAPHRIDLNLELKGQINPDTGEPYDNIQDEVDSGMSFAMAKQEYLNEAVDEYEGTYFSYELEAARGQGRVNHFGGIKKGDRIFTSWDIGLSDHMSVGLFKEIPGRSKAKKDRRFRWVGYMENTGKKYEYYFNELKTWAGEAGFEFAGHYIPHDGNKRNGETLKKFKDVAAEHGFLCRVVRKTDRVKNDIEVCRGQWTQWEVDLDGQEMELYLDYIGKYREDPKTGRPKHDKDGSSHGGDACRTGMMAVEYDQVMDYMATFAEEEQGDHWFDGTHDDIGEDDYSEDEGGYALDYYD